MIKTTLFRGVTYSVIVILASSPFMVSAADGLFGTYFQRMTGGCPSGSVLTGFSITPGEFGNKTCTSLLGIIGGLYGAYTAPEGQAMIGFTTTGEPRFGHINWQRAGTNIGFAGGRVGIGTTTPTALLDIHNGDARIHDLTVGRGGGGVLGNVAIGYASLQNNLPEGASNVAVGALALQSNLFGTQNTAIGPAALSSNTAGENNTGIGSNALRFTINGGWNTAIGSAALMHNISGVGNVAIGTQALYNVNAGQDNIGIGRFAGGNIQMGMNNIAIGQYALVPNHNGSNQIRMGNQHVTYAGIQVPWTITSDRTLKSNIENTTLGLDFIRDLNPVSYTRNNDIANKVEYGFIAQDVNDTLHKYGITTSGMVGKDDLGIYSIRYNDLLAPMVKSIQELSYGVATLNQTIEKHNEEISALNKRLDQLEMTLVK